MSEDIRTVLALVVLPLVALAVVACVDVYAVGAAFVAIGLAMAAWAVRLIVRA
jgi:hypothetical protein